MKEHKSQVVDENAVMNENEREMRGSSPIVVGCIKLKPVAQATTNTFAMAHHQGRQESGGSSGLKPRKITRRSIGTMTNDEVRSRLIALEIRCFEGYHSELADRTRCQGWTEIMDGKTYQPFPHRRAS